MLANSHIDQCRLVHIIPGALAAQCTRAWTIGRLCRRWQPRRGHGAMQRQTISLASRGPKKTGALAHYGMESNGFRLAISRRAEVLGEVRLIGGDEPSWGDIRFPRQWGISSGAHLPSCCVPCRC